MKTIVMSVFNYSCMRRKQSTHCNYVKQNIVSHYNLFIPLMKRRFLSLLDKSSVVRSGCVNDILTIGGCVYDILTIGVCFWYTYDRGVFMIFLRSGVFMIYLRSGCVYMWYTYDAGVFMIYLRSGCVYIWYTYDVGVFDILTMRVCL